MNVKERKLVENDKFIEEDAFNTTQKKQKELKPTYQVMVLTRVINMIQDLVSGGQILEDFSSYGVSSNPVSNDLILSILSDQTKKSLMNIISKKHKERDDDIKSSIAKSDEERVDFKILHHVLEKLIWKWQLKK